MSIDPLEVTYQETQKLIQSVVHSLHREFGGDLEEMLSEANVFWMTAYNTFDPKLACFSTWLTIQLRRRFQSERRAKAIRHARLKQVDYPLQLVKDESMPSFDMEEFCAVLSDDAKSIIRLVFDPPPDIHWEMVVRGRNTPTGFRTILKEFLRLKGWTLIRILCAYQEIRKALD